MGIYTYTVRIVAEHHKLQSLMEELKNTSCELAHKTEKSDGRSKSCCNYETVAT